MCFYWSKYLTKADKFIRGRMGFSMSIFLSNQFLHDSFFSLDLRRDIAKIIYLRKETHQNKKRHTKNIYLGK